MVEPASVVATHLGELLASHAHEILGRRELQELLELSGRETGLLEILLQRPGRLVSKEQIVNHLCEWGEELSHNAVEVYMHRLRRKLEGGGERVVGPTLERATLHVRGRRYRGARGRDRPGDGAGGCGGGDRRRGAARWGGGVVPPG